MSHLSRVPALESEAKAQKDQASPWSNITRNSPGPSEPLGQMLAHDRKLPYLFSALKKVPLPLQGTCRFNDNTTRNLAKHATKLERFDLVTCINATDVTGSALHEHVWSSGVHLRLSWDRRSRLSQETLTHLCCLQLFPKFEASAPCTPTQFCFLLCTAEWPNTSGSTFCNLCFRPTGVHGKATIAFSPRHSPHSVPGGLRTR